MLSFQHTAVTTAVPIQISSILINRQDCKKPLWALARRLKHRIWESQNNNFILQKELQIFFL